jgi:Secretion system C-terminal sorting domain
MNFSGTMERKLFSALMIGTSLWAQAQLAPTADAPLFQHLMEVNSEWRTMDPSPAGGDRIVHFANEAERIATHLRMVRERLEARTSSTTGPAIKARLELLNDLARYADRGIFPQNQVLPVRNPIFIDPVGTACAVGQLMIESGHRDLAQHIHDEMNTAYVHDMHRAEVGSWAVAHGFTEDELAWIQPGYPPAVPWASFGGGTNGVVKELLKLSNGDMLVAGTFTTAGGTAANRVARYNGTTYSAMPGLPPGDIHTAIEYNGFIYVGGAFNAGQADLAKWNGASWTLESAFSSKSGETDELHIHNGVLHAAGSASGFAGISFEVHRLDGNTWNPVGQALNAKIRTLETFNGTLVCAGDFTDNFLVQDSTLLHTATLSGNTWEQLGDGLNGRVFDLLVDNEMLYAGGDCIAEINPFFGLARIGAGASDWEALMPNLSTYIFSPTDGLVSIEALFAFDGLVYFGGSFDMSVGMDQGHGLGAFNGAPDDVSVMAALDGTVNDLDLFGDEQLVAGGSFFANAGSEVGYVMVTDLINAVPEPSSNNAQLVVWPNPTVDRLFLSSTSARMQNARITILDNTGRSVKRAAYTNNLGIDVRSLASGTYTVLFENGTDRRSARFVMR